MNEKLVSNSEEKTKVIDFLKKDMNDKNAEWAKIRVILKNWIT